MRTKAATILLVGALTLTTGACTDTPSGALGGTSCHYVRGTATFKPGLPKKGGPRVLTTITIKGARLSGCPTMSSGTLDVTLKAKVAGNCQDFRKGADLKFSGPGTIKWKNGESSTIGVKLVPALYYGRRAQRLTGGVTVGKFRGSGLSVLLTSFFSGYPPCAQDLTSVNFAEYSYLIIR